MLSNLRGNQRMEVLSTRSCHIPPSYHMGGVHLVRVLEFEDGMKWVARIPLGQCTSDTKKRLLHEVHILSLLRERTEIPVPKVFGYETNGNIIGRAFMIMELIPGSTAMDAFGGWEVHNGEIPARFKSAFCRSIAEIQVAMSEIRFPKIGMIMRHAGGSYDVDSIPGIGGPFETAAEYFAAWSNTVKFPMRDIDIRSRLPSHWHDEVPASIGGFPDKIKEALHILSVKNEGPFPLFHPDFRHSNVIIDGDYNILSVIDWEHAGTVPWGVVDFPLFLGVVPPPMDLPTNYDAEGNPVDEETRKLRRERNDYVQSVRDFEERGSDNSLSTILASPYIQNIATALGLYENGKLGLYCKLFDEL
ncbi:hypothetical protein DTO027I6_8420 [Penicillium roqueforti]|uniref:uncharacterized protein n=1 Tax=Penicillium roqueforti TaxID=5082 RepID=UPI00190D2509|nr:uncharacterized protein LCP9604111_9519 [Penicillium roqueforti]KAF9238315.1 hypothetical protein LCP9604111_9519 [Penicillium roqueforti]KAI1830811.1 hypothetical protein CBS147337_8428 [Penicillium roqueforti]KAI3121482.1 hypothetical protein CBS147330_7984 [Penicillium roqueforti]KAI3147450.1 hypothetical protein CBS147317_8859 [Penicillium roqueforti]KAI3190828.1 hypothetical protein DTO027I6_8420 [Penicillium roqueforti]